MRVLKTRDMLFDASDPSAFGGRTVFSAEFEDWAIDLHGTLLERDLEIVSGWLLPGGVRKNSVLLLLRFTRRLGDEDRFSIAATVGLLPVELSRAAHLRAAPWVEAPEAEDVFLIMGLIEEMDRFHETVGIPDGLRRRGAGPFIARKQAMGMLDELRAISAAEAEARRRKERALIHGQGWTMERGRPVDWSPFPED